GTRRTTRRCVANGSAARHEVGPGGSGDWHRDWLGTNSAHDPPAVRRDRTRPAYICCRFEPADYSGRLGLLRSGAARHTRRSSGGASLRIAPPSRSSKSQPEVCSEYLRSLTAESISSRVRQTAASSRQDLSRRKFWRPMVAVSASGET